MDKESDCISFITFLLNKLKMISNCFEGKVKINDNDEKMIISPCLFIPLDLPPMPLYPDNKKEKIIPQIILYDLLDKYNNETKTFYGKKWKKYSIWELPKILIIVIKRFTNGEKNHTIVEFERELEMLYYLHPEAPKGQITKFVSSLK